MATIGAGAPADQARKWWMGELARRANEAGVELAALPITPAQVARVCALVAAGDAQRQAGPPGHRGRARRRGRPGRRSSTKRGLKVVSDDGALGAAVDEAIAANPGVADKIRGGKLAAAGALVGAVMKATRGQADAARVRELILEKLEAQG